MDPTGTPPWRVLEAPSEGEPRSAASPTEPATAPRPWHDSGMRALAVVLVAVALAAVAFGLAMTSGTGDAVVVEVAAVGSAGADLDPASSGLAGDIVVEVVGAVVKPGVVRLPVGSRVADLIAAAGGYGPRVDTARAATDLHLATVLADGDRIQVPSRDDPVSAPATPAADGPGGAGDVLVNLNDATLEQLDTLPGIGPVTAEKILAAREEARFTTVDELRSRGVLGEKTFERIRDLVTID